MHQSADRTPFSQPVTYSLKGMSDVDAQPVVAEVEAETSFMGSEDEEMAGRASWHSESDPLVARGRAGNDSAEQPDKALSKVEKWRNIIGFWILGLCNNYPYVIMLSAAFDIITYLESSNKTPCTDNSTNTSSCSLIFNETTNTSYYIGREKCNRQGTSVILLADILPTFIIKLVAPYFMNFIPYWIRVLTVVLTSLLSFILVGLALNEPLVLFGVVCASIGSGFGEITFLSFTARYDKSTVSSWSSGTGAAGVAGALVYAGLKAAGLSDAVTLFIQTFMPILMLVTYLFVLGKPGSIIPEAAGKPNNGETSSNGSTAENSKQLGRTPPHVENVPTAQAHSCTGEDTKDVDDKVLLVDNDPAPRYQRILVKVQAIYYRIKPLLFNQEELAFWWSHVKYIPYLFKYMVPLFVVYTAEYMINQGLFELLYYPNTHIGALCLNQQAQYRWLQVIYQIGVFISRSSVSVVHIKHFWILSVLQVINFVLLFCEAIYLFIPSFWITFFIILYEGLLGGGVYVNGFYAISKEVPKIHREFSMGVTSVGDSTGIVLAGLVATFGIHVYICSHFIGWNC